MSFILDALKKLEERRQNESLPDLMTVHAEVGGEQKKRQILPYLIVIALLFNALILAVLLSPPQTGNKTFTAQAAKKEIHTPAPAVPKVEQVVTETASLKSMPQEPSKEPPAPLTEKDESPVINPSPEELMTLRSKIKEEQDMIDRTPAPETAHEEITGQKTERTVIDFGQVPMDIRSGLPDITIKGHIYSNDPSSRLVNINGSIVREGNMITQGLTVDEITMSGVVFNYDGLLFRVRAF
jgi:general secretion pathway protein B